MVDFLGQVSMPDLQALNMLGVISDASKKILEAPQTRKPRKIELREGYAEFIRGRFVTEPSQTRYTMFPLALAVVNDFAWF